MIPAGSTDRADDRHVGVALASPDRPARVCRRRVARVHQVGEVLGADEVFEEAGGLVPGFALPAPRGTGEDPVFGLAAVSAPCAAAAAAQGDGVSWATAALADLGAEDADGNNLAESQACQAAKERLRLGEVGKSIVEPRGGALPVGGRWLIRCFRNRAAGRLPWARFLPPLSEPGVPISGTGLSSGIMRLAHGFPVTDQRTGLRESWHWARARALAGRCVVGPVDAPTTATAQVVPFAYACDDIWHSC